MDQRQRSAARDARMAELERRYGTRWLGLVARSDLLTDVFGDVTDVDIHDWSKWKRQQRR